ncbi:HEPN domain-containing protein [Sulfuriroseicoccus oceanibius]|uniref:RiboL-PSP-HEPN domain-containing protein n=1 Tax=Sulfuriroseicoccus oceanibius TaxID=2707525 RepID=A0A6B3L7S3_9BACT|nr:HEPN domain-containing protein [Sulfuriroseicoccus oceanibius]QQL44060.1 hypothetical protein G3M56_009155 [Sulfuriroseicoccus oceanibius]
MPSKSLTQFESVLKRATDLRDLAEFLLSDEAKLKLDDDGKFHGFSDMGRASIVLAVSAMDQYFTRRFCELLVPFLKKNGPTDGLIEILGEAGFDTKEALVAIGMRRPYRRIRTLVENHLENYTTQRFEVIDNLFLSIGLKDLSNNAEKKTKRTTVISSITKLVQRRHAIAHAGDLNNHGKLCPIDFKQLKKRFKDLNDFVTAADQIIENRLKKK